MQYVKMPLVSWLLNYALRCDAAFKVDASTDLSKLKVGQLKQFMASNGITCKECVEKQDFVAKVREFIASSVHGEL